MTRSPASMPTFDCRKCKQRQKRKNIHISIVLFTKYIIKYSSLGHHQRDTTINTQAMFIYFTISVVTDGLSQN